MSKLVSECPICHKKNVVEKNCNYFEDLKFISLSCGHTYKEQLKIADKETITLKDGKSLYPFQVEGFKFAEKSNFSCLIADEQGLGKTIQAIAIMNEHLDDLKPILCIVKSSLTLQWQRHILSEMDRFAQILLDPKDVILPCAIYIISFDMVGKFDWEKIKPSIKTVIIDECQYIKNHEAKRTNAVRNLINRTIVKRPTIVVEKNKTNKIKHVEMIAKDLMKYHGISDRFKLTIVNSLGSTLGLTKCRVEGEGIITGEIVLSSKHITESPISDVIETILHEIAHAITPGAGHVQIWKETSLSIGGNGQAYTNCVGSIEEVKEVEEHPVQYKILLSGTPILNNATEYWPALNILRPNLFPNRDRFVKWEVGYYQNSKGVWKPGGVRYPKEFKEKTKDFIIRRTKKEVLPELPTITRDFRYHEINADETKAYDLGVKKLDEFLKNADTRAFNFTSDLQGHIMILRHITGLAKVRPILEYIDEFIENEGDSNGNRKLAIFCHHIDVANILAGHLETRENLGFIKIDSTMSVDKRMELLDKFRVDDNARIMIAPALAMGEGYDLEFCDTGIMLEREWNPAKEEQVEGRFIRATPESIAKGAKGELKATMVYPIAVNTIDEFFAELVERKRQYVKETLDGKSEYKWNESDVMLELAKITVERWKS